MTDMHLAAYFLSFIGVWIGAGLIVSSIDTFSKRLGISSFAVSFFILGLLTSIPEFAVGITSIARHEPSIYMGNLLGGIVVLFLFVIPLLAVFGREIRLGTQISSQLLLLSFAVLALPPAFLADRRISFVESMYMILAYAVVILYVERRHGILDTANTHILKVKRYGLMHVFKLLAGTSIVFLSGRMIVDGTVYYAGVLGLSPFVVSLLLMSVGTNMPELSIALRAVISGKKDIALGDYIGSALANVLFFGLFSIFSLDDTIRVHTFIPTSVFIILSLVLFWFFSRSNRNISRREGLILLAFYCVYISTELAIR